MKRVLAAVALTLLGALALAAPASAGARWSKARTLGRGELLGIDSAPGGNTVALLSTRKGVSIAVARPGSRFDTPIAVPGSRASESLAMATNARGDTVVVWTESRFVEEDPEGGECCDFVVAATRHGGGRFTSPQRLTNPSDGYGDEPIEPPAVAIGPGGRTVVAWPESCEPFATITRAGRPFPAKRRVAPFDEGICDLNVSSQDPAPAVTAEGAVLFTYALGELGEPRELRSMRVSPSGKRASRVLARRGPKDFNNTIVLTSRKGERLALWETDSGLMTGFASLRTESLRANRIGSVELELVAGAPSGAALIAVDGFRSGISLLARLPGGPFGRRSDVPRGLSRVSLHGGISDRGAVALAGRSLDGRRVRVAAGPSVRSLPIRGAYSCQSRSCGDPVVTIADQAGALAAWQDGSRIRFGRTRSTPR